MQQLGGGFPSTVSLPQSLVGYEVIVYAFLYDPFRNTAEIKRLSNSVYFFFQKKNVPYFRVWMDFLSNSFQRILFSSSLFFFWLSFLLRGA